VILVVVIGLAGLAAVAGTVMATPGQGFTATQQWKGVFDDIRVSTDGNLPHRIKLWTKEASDIYVTRNTIAVDGHSGWHTHPGPSLIIVTVGEIMAYEGDDPTCTPKRYRAGEGFVDPGDGHVHLLRNESGAPAETVAVQFLPKDATRRLDAPASGNCPF
jgi:quercetin dioxygenase-like cupin family protein